MNYYDDQQQELQRQMAEQQRAEEERQKREQERQRQQMLAARQAQSPAAGGIDLNQGLSMYSSFAGESPAAGGISAGAGGETAAGGAGSGAGGMGSAWPLAVAAAVIAHNEWAKKKGMHTDKDALTGRALYKDAEWYQPRLNDKVDGMGDEVKLASLGSSPADLFKKDTWSTAAKLAAQGGILGKALKKIF